MAFCIPIGGIAMSLRTRLVGSLLFPLHERVKGHTTTSVHRDLDKTQWLSTSEIQALQLQKLRDFLTHLEQEVPYYRELFASLAFRPAEVEALADLQRLPLLDKPIIRAQGDALKADNASALSRFNTGGSSGEPLVFYLGKDRVSHDVAAKRRATRWWGVDIGDPELVVWGSPIELGSQDRLRVWRDRLFRSELLPAFEMSEQNLDRFVERIRSYRPRMLFGYPSSLALIARHAEARGITLTDLGIRVAFVTSERLYDEQRADIERVFACPVANGYGGRDAGFIAHACPQGSLHITAEDLIVEIVDSRGEPVPVGESGEIVVTHMHTRDFPFLRYKTGDVGALSSDSCACGRGLPILERLEGRTTDFVIAQDGTVLHGLSLIYVLRDRESIGEFRIEQESIDKIRVQLITRTPLDEAEKHEIIAQFRERLGDSVDVELLEVEDIPREKSGKYRYVVSKVAVQLAVDGSEEGGPMVQKREGLHRHD